MSTTINKEFDIVSVGDCVMDCIMYVNRMPKMGETMKANNFVCLPGGKGGNSIVASSRLGSKNAFISKLGNDMFGKTFIEVLKADNIDTQNVTFTDTSPTSVATILVDTSGKNAIAVNFGSTLELSESDIDNADEIIKKSKILVTTRMVNEPVALYALKTAKKNNLISVFNFAPATSELSSEFDQYVDFLIVNEVEAEVFIGEAVKSVEDAIKACEIILKREGFYLGCVVTLGEAGSVFGDKRTGEITHFECPKVKAVDSTGAGDAFVGAFCHYISKLGVDSVKRAVELAGEYASLTVQFKGTQASYPHLSSLDDKFK